MNPLQTAFDGRRGADPSSWVYPKDVRKHREERSDRGFSTFDVMNFETYLSWVIAQGARWLAENDHTHPRDLTPVEWSDILTEMADGFDAYLRYESDFSGDPEEAHAKLDRSLDLFKERFTSLWD